MLAHIKSSERLEKSTSIRAIDLPVQHIYLIYIYLKEYLPTLYLPPDIYLPARSEIGGGEAPQLPISPAGPAVSRIKRERQMISGRSVPTINLSRGGCQKLGVFGEAAVG